MRFPVTAVIARTLISSDLRASEIASASSMPGSVSMRTFFMLAPSFAGQSQFSGANDQGYGKHNNKRIMAGRSHVGYTAILSHIVIDEIYAAGALRAVSEVGGAGAYAAIGASLAGRAWDSALVSGVGSEDRIALSGWCAHRQIDSSGLFVASEHSPRTRIEYYADGERDETPVFGLEHFDAHTPLPEHIPFAPTDLRGTYLFHAHESEYWSKISDFRSRSTSPILWELSRDSCSPMLLGTVVERAQLVDIVSINRTEAFALLATSTVEETIHRLRDFSTTVLLRLGHEGSVIVDGTYSVAIPPVKVRVVDPTGGGNSYSGAFIAAFAVSGNLADAGRLAAASAGLVISQQGAPLVSDTERDWVEESAGSLTLRTI
ncbi:MAG: hypothetical protein B5766_08155 [Candidatus Lumbricidophila eiseniae]|uniref:Carbohydrate kinase PfkB domain-containing protein n=1 Tax=Candidatus Lumbricidiphila eiseniae TaxID=1969409 RepID=A0A2A6FQD6_9MICO|nr:MAG: hypothetical protein B5766_08155 [Candidatus Lumbricidophila eiseniae]